ncbi:MlaE family ABC transporter permease [Bacteroidota bacterium]
MSRKQEKHKEEDYKYQSDDGLVLLKPVCSLTLNNASVYDHFTLNYKYLDDVKKFTVDLSQLEDYDSYFVVFILALKNQCEIRGIEFTVTGMINEMAHYFEALTPKGQIEAEDIHISFWFHYISNIGDKTKTLLKDTVLFIEFLGSLVIKMLSLLIKPGNMRWKDFPYHFTETGVHAVPITILIVFLIGLISGYQGALQLSQFGADILIADLIGISITRELAPLMTAILVAGRSGSAFAAEIGTMKVSEEIDALESMGFDYMNFLVLPRVMSVMLAMPILIMLTDLAGILGGLVAAITTLDITVAGYINELHRAIDFSDIFSGMSKAVVFGFLIATVGCFKGMQVRGGAESVGKYTTASVVSGIFLIILFDALFTYIFSILGI